MTQPRVWTFELEGLFNGERRPREGEFTWFGDTPPKFYRLPIMTPLEHIVGEPSALAVPAETRYIEYELVFKDPAVGFHRDKNFATYRRLK